MNKREKIIESHLLGVPDGEALKLYKSKQATYSRIEKLQVGKTTLPAGPINTTSYYFYPP